MKTETNWLEEHMRRRLSKQPLNEDLEMLKRAANNMKDAEARASRSQARAQTMSDACAGRIEDRGANAARVGGRAHRSGSRAAESVGQAQRGRESTRSTR